VDIFHIIDPRTQHGVSSKYADSQSITPGEKLSHAEIIRREKTQVYLALERLLSKEASRLNYPLKINRIIESDNVEKRLKSEFRNKKYSMLVTSLKLENTIFGNLNELFSITRNLNSLTFIIPPRQKFHMLRKAVLITDFSRDTYTKMRQLFKWLKPFEPFVNACEVIKMNQFIETEVKIKAWKQVVKKYFDPPTTLKANVIKGDDYHEALLNYVWRNDPDVVILPKTGEKSSGFKLSPVNNTKRLIEKVKKPVLLC